MTVATPRRHRKSIRSLAVSTTLLLGIGCGGEEVDGRAPSPSSSVPPATSRAAVEPLENLLWLLSPTGECPPPDVVPVQTFDDPTLAFLQALGLEPYTQPACRPTQGP